MKFAFRGASSAALIIGITGGLHSAWAQQAATPATPASPQSQTVTTAQPATQPAPQAASQADQTSQPAEQGATDRVVVTGSLIATAPEDAPKPVEVYTAEDLKNRGSPSVSEFVRSLTGNFASSSGVGSGLADQTAGIAAGFANADLRGLGANGTLVLMNGRRLSTTNGGNGADINTIPSEALEAVEVLKDGASTTYGAGAVGGVINFRTRRDIDAPIISVNKTMYDGSEGEYEVDLQTGWVGDAGNILLSLHYGRTEAMSQLKRDFAHLPFNVNPSVYSLNAPNPGRYHTSTGFLTTPVVAGAVNDLPGSVGAAATSACRTVGGEIITNLNNSSPATSSNTGCALKQFFFQDLVNESDDYRFFGEANLDLSDTMEFHFDFTYSKLESRRNDIPTLAPTGRSTDSAVSTLGCAASCQFVIPVQVSTYQAGGTPTAPTAGTVNAGIAPIRNPFVDDFIARTGVSAAALPTTGAVYTAANWRPFGYGGNPLYENGRRQEIVRRDRILLNVGLKGEFSGDSVLGNLLNGITYDYSATYNQYIDENVRPDISIARLQNALLGYGGSGCLATDLVPTDYSSAAAFNRTVGIQSNTRPGTNGCQWFNPFASAWPTSIASGAANPMFNAGNPTLPAGSTSRPTGYQNPTDLVDWMTVDRFFENLYQATTMDFTWTGQLPESIQLPGGQIGWAAGTQWRLVERRNVSGSGNSQAERFLNLADCPYPDPSVDTLLPEAIQAPGQRGCAGTGPGAFFGTGDHTETYTDSQTLAYYAEIQLPVLDNLNLSASVRREEFNGGKITGDIWSIAGKYDITDNLYVRASYGTNFRAEEALDADPGLVLLTTAEPARFGGQLSVNNLRITSPDIAPEDDRTFNAGVGYDADIGDGRLRASVDFFEITIDGDVTTTTTATVFNNVFGNNSATCQADRSNAAACGTLNAVAGLPSIPTNGNDNPGQFANCSARLISLVVFSGSCVQGVTTASNLAGSITSEQNGPRRVTNGIDYSFDYSHPLLDGTVGVNFTATQNLVYKTQGFDVFGIPFELPQDRLGFVNNGLFRQISEWRANATVRWANESHNVNLRMDYIQGVHDERDPLFVGTDIYPNAGTLTDIDAGTSGTQFSPYGVVLDDYVQYDFNYIYTAPFWEELEFRLAIVNLTDENPWPAQNRNGYLASVGDPRGRRFELGVTKKF